MPSLMEIELMNLYSMICDSKIERSEKDFILKKINKLLEVVYGMD